MTSSKNIPINKWGNEERPREKLYTKGSSSLSDSELLGILIRNGHSAASAIDIAKQLLSKVDFNINELGKLSVQAMMNYHIKGLGMVKCVTIVAALELGIRRESSIRYKKHIKSSNEIADYLRAHYQHLSKEVFIVVFLSQSNSILHTEVISEGGISSTIVDIRIILKKALEHNSVNIVLAHNHPSGNLVPSQQDRDITAKVKKGALLLDIKLLDHIIISEQGFLSFLDKGYL